MYSLDFTQHNITQSDYDAAITAQTREFRNRVSFGYWSGTPRTFTSVVQFTAGIRSLSVNQVVNSDSKLTMGNACSSALKLDFFKPDTNENLSNKVVRIESGLQVGDQIIYVPVGYFNIAEFISEDDYRTIQITGYDDMERLSEKWTPGQTTPTTAKDVVDGIAARHSVSVEYSTAAGTALSGKILSAAQLALLTSYTEREVLGLMAGIGGANAFFDARGVLCVKWYTASGVTVPLTLQWQGGLKKTQNEPFTVASVTSGVDDQVHTAGTGKGLTFVNPLITPAEVQTIYDAVKNTSFLPCEVLWRGNPLVGCGDIVTVHDKHNNTYPVYVAGQEIDLTGGFSQKIICPTADGEINFQTADERTALAINLAKTDLQQAMIENTEIIRGANGGYVALLDRDGDDGNDALIISSTPITDPEDPENPNADYIIATHTGIGLHDGSSGQLFGTAITGKGINADAITAGQMSADRLSIGTPAKVRNLILDGDFCKETRNDDNSGLTASGYWKWNQSDISAGSATFFTDSVGKSFLLYLPHNRDNDLHTLVSANSCTIAFEYNHDIPVTGGKTYSFGADFTCSGYSENATPVSSGTAGMFVTFYNDDKSRSFTFGLHKGNKTVSPGNRKRFFNQVTAFTWATKAVVKLEFYHTKGNNDSFSFGRIMFFEDDTPRVIDATTSDLSFPFDDLLHPTSGNVSASGEGLNIYQGAFNIYDANGVKRLYSGSDGWLNTEGLTIRNGDFKMLSPDGQTVVGFSQENGSIGDLFIASENQFYADFGEDQYNSGHSNLNISAKTSSGSVELSYESLFENMPVAFQNLSPLIKISSTVTGHGNDIGALPNMESFMNAFGFVTKDAEGNFVKVQPGRISVSGTADIFDGFFYNGVRVESVEEAKTNITPAASMLAKILSADIYNYDYVSEVEDQAETEEPELILNGEPAEPAEPATPQHYGLVIGEGYNTPEEVISKDGKGVDLYSMISIAWKAIQEQQAQIAALEQRIAALEGNE